MDELDYMMIDQINKHQKEKEVDQWRAKVDRAKASGSLLAKIQFAAIVVVVLLALILVPAPFPR